MVKTREEKKQHDWFLEAKVVMCVGGGKESRHWGRKKEIKTTWDDVSSRNKENRNSSRNGEYKFLWEEAKVRIAVCSGQKGTAWETTGKTQQSSYLLMQIV